MSLLQDALKASQREKDRRASAANPPAPLIVPLRSKPKAEFSWRNAMTIAVSLVVIVGSLWTLYVRLGGSWRPSTPMAATSGAAPGGGVSPAGEARPDVARPLAQVPTPPASARTDSAPQPTTAAVRAAESPRTPRSPTRIVRRPPAPAAVATLQGRAADTATTPSPSQPAGRLRISVEQPRAYEAARLFAVGVAAHRAGDLDAARSAYERVLAMAPNDVDALNNLGVLLAAQREFDRAEQVLRRVVLLAPRNATGWNNLGTVLAQSGHAGEAVAAFQQALQIDPSSAAARVSLAQQHLAIGSAARARELLEEAVASNPSLAEAQYTLGQACEMLKDWPGAIRAYNAFIRVAPARMAADVDRVRGRVEALGARVR